MAASFAMLPPELTQEIWKIALLQESQERLVVVSDDCQLVYNFTYGNIGIPTIIPLKYLVSPLLSVNRESRHMAKVFYDVQLKVLSPSIPQLPAALADRQEYDSLSVYETLSLMGREAKTEINYQHIYQETQEELRKKYECDKAYWHKFCIKEGCRYEGPEGYDRMIHDWTNIAKAKAGPSLLPGKEKGIVHLKPERDTFAISPQKENWRFLIEREPAIAGPGITPACMGLYHISEAMPQSVCDRVQKVARLDYWDPNDSLINNVRNCPGGFQEVWNVWEYQHNQLMPNLTLDGEPFRRWGLCIFFHVKTYFSAFLGSKEADAFLPDLVACGGKSPHKLCELTSMAWKLKPGETRERQDQFLIRDLRQEDFEYGERDDDFIY